MTQTCKIPKDEIKGMKMWNPYALKNTYHYNNGNYETGGHLLFQPLNCGKKVSITLFSHSEVHIFV